MLALQHRTALGGLQRKTDCSRSLNGGGIARTGVQSSVPHRCPCGGGCPSCNSSLQRQALALTSSDSAQGMAEPGATAASPMRDGTNVGEPRRLSPPTRLEGNGPGDVYEQEAGRIADRVMTQSDDRAVSDAPPRIQAFSMPPIGPTPHRLADVNQAPAWARQTAGAHAAARHGAALRPGFVPGPRAFRHGCQSIGARLRHAKLYAVGRDIVFGANQYSPATREALYSIADELAHVIQQRDGPSAIKPGIRLRAARLRHPAATRRVLPPDRDAIRREVAC